MFAPSRQWSLEPASDGRSSYARAIQVEMHATNDVFPDGVIAVSLRGCGSEAFA